MTKQLLLGCAEINITPDQPGLFLAGSLDPRGRPAKDTHDPLFVRTAVFESNGIRMAYVIFDLTALEKDIMADYLTKAAELSDIPVDNIVWSCSHSHSAPNSMLRCYTESSRQAIDMGWLHGALGKFVECVHKASQNMVPVRMSRHRGFHYNALHNRRLRFKNGWHINTWLLENVDEDVQSIGSAGPVDPELGIVAFDDDNGVLQAVVYHYTLHANRRGGVEYSADYPGVVAQKIKEKYGNQVVPLYMPGACGDINPLGTCDEIGNALADIIIARLDERQPGEKITEIGVEKKTFVVPLRDIYQDQEERIIASKWPPKAQEYFRQTCNELRKEGKNETEAVIHTWHIGDIAFATNPGELFVDWGLEIKAGSQFPWTYPIELCGDWIGYLITEDAWQHGGYEGLNARTAYVSVEGVRMIVDESEHMLNTMRKKQVLRATYPAETTLRNGETVTVRPLSVDDGEKLAYFYAQIPDEDIFFYCPHPLDRENALKKAARAECPCFVCLVLETAQDEIAGYAWYQWKAGADKSSFGICIRRDHHGIGAGKTIMSNLMQTAAEYGPPRMSLTVQKANAGAVTLYQKLGFHIVREQVRGSDQEPEYYMEKYF